MENNFFKSVIDADDAPVVICDLENTIVYMNPTAVKRYEKIDFCSSVSCSSFLDSTMASSSIPRSSGI